MPTHINDLPETDKEIVLHTVTRQKAYKTVAGDEHMKTVALKAHSHGAIFSECDCVFIYRMEWVVWMSMILFTL